VGDFVMATPALRALRVRFGDASISLLGRPLMADLVSGGDWADEFIEWEPKRRHRRSLGLVGLARRLRRRRFDWAVLLTNSFRSALLVRLAGCKRRVGYDRDGRGPLLTDRLPVARDENGAPKITRMVDYYGVLAEHVGCAPPGEVLELFTDAAGDEAAQTRIERLGLSDRRPLVVLSPGASFGASKLWPVEQYAGLGDRLTEAHGAAVLISCAPGEEAIARDIAAKMNGPAHVLDEPVTTLSEFKSVVRTCDLLICNDAGARHVAKAFGRPVVTIFGPTHPGWTDTDYPLERKMMIPVDCGPCQKKLCPLDHRCMTGVSVEMVAAAADELLANRQDEAA
jgi:heptosyltransferase-2